MENAIYFQYFSFYTIPINIIILLIIILIYLGIISIYFFIIYLEYDFKK